MGWFVNVHVVDLDRVHGAIGSGDDALLRLIEEKFAEELAEDAEDNLDYGDWTLAQALQFVIMGTLDGEEVDGDLEERAAEAYEYICEAVCLATWGGGPYGRDWLECSSRGFVQLRIDAINFEQFEMPRPSTPWDDLMTRTYYGEWSHEDCVQAVAQWESTTAEQRRALDPGDLEIVETAIELARTATQSAAYGVVGFFHT